MGCSVVLCKFNVVFLFSTLRVWDDAQRHIECHGPAAYVVCGVPGPEPTFVLTGNSS